ncbi:MAG: SUMF1/EgtB/PvdO family nonheme iron enzyme [Terracidiphilus sp.]|nr:SUMF1/EgtB/PvdO family nonheme iron enzyme [Terracidiphilus sp.]
MIHAFQEIRAMNPQAVGSRSILVLTLALASLTSSSPAQDSKFAPFTFLDEQIPAPVCLTLHNAWEGEGAPCTAQTHHEWLADLQHWRAERRIRVGFDPARYSMPVFKWAQSDFIQPQMMVHDRFFYDPTQGKYTVDRYLDDLTKRYGGIDSVLVWATYPNMGIDDRNQLDMVRSMLGGIEGVRQMVSDFHRRGVHVLFPMMMWDQGTREPQQPWPDAIAGLMKQIDADGINGDTQDGVPLAFSLAADKAGHPLAFEPETGVSDEALSWNVLTWGYYKFQFVPSIDRHRWLETRHMVHISDRWNRNHTDNLQFAFFNGEGFESWENIWGIWNGITPADAEATRRIASIERAFAPFLTSPDWEPFYSTHLYGVFASRWPLGEQTLWTIVNRNEYNTSGRQITVPYKPGLRYFDLYHGVELKPEVESDRAVLSFDAEAHGYAAILSTPTAPDAATLRFLDTMKSMTATPLSTYPHEWQVVKQSLVEIPPTIPASSAPAGMVRIGAADYLFTVQGIEIEGSNDMGIDVQYPWEDSARRFHEHRIQIKPFFIDKFPVTNADFKKFIDATSYLPKDAYNFLKDWKNGTYPDGAANKPVTWVSLEDARAYAAWAGKRLPHEWEWQYAAQGNDRRIYPWGSCDWLAQLAHPGQSGCTVASAQPGSFAPTPDKDRVMLAAADVNAHPDGASPFGVMDMVGNVWQWTDEYIDEHTRAAILRGGSHYQPQGSVWYFPQAYRNNQHGKLLLMAPSYDRSGAVGFRCVKDAE